MSDLYIIDERAPFAAQLVDFVPTNDIAFMVGPRDAIHDVVDRAQEALDRSRHHGGRIRRMVILAHGAPGHVQLGTGLDVARVHELAPLRRRFRAGLLSSAWIFGCNVGSATARGPNGWGSVDSGWGASGSSASVTGGLGMHLLLAMARTLHTEVSAPIDSQHLPPAEYRRLLQGTLYEGTYLTATPTGAWRIADESGIRADSHAGPI